MSLGIKSSAFLRVFMMGSWIHDGFLDSWNPCVKDFRVLDLLESIIGFNKSFVQWAGIEVKNKKLMPILRSPLAWPGATTLACLYLRSPIIFQASLVDLEVLVPGSYSKGTDLRSSS